MTAKNLPREISHNVIAEWRGSEKPEEVVVVSGHLDSWDVGVGAMDDGGEESISDSKERNCMMCNSKNICVTGGAFISWQVLSTLRNLNLRPKRTIRLIMWTCEEFGGIGSFNLTYLTL